MGLAWAGLVVNGVQGGRGGSACSGLCLRRGPLLSESPEGRLGYPRRPCRPDSLYREATREARASRSESASGLLTLPARISLEVTGR